MRGRMRTAVGGLLLAIIVAGTSGVANATGATEAITVTPSEGQFRGLVSGIWDMVAVSNTVCDVVGCSARWSSSGASKAITYLDRAKTIYSLADAMVLGVRLGADEREFNTAMQAAHHNKHDPKVVGRP